MAKAAKEKDCEVVKKWQRGISNHVYWCATSSSSGPEKLAKWKSVMNHMQNKHEHDNPIFPKCLHPDRNSTDRKKWFKPGTYCYTFIMNSPHVVTMPFEEIFTLRFIFSGTKAIQRMEKILVNKRVLNDVEKLSSRYQTSTLEAFHSLMLRFTPKNVVFPFIGMLCRYYMFVNASLFNMFAVVPVTRIAMSISSKKKCVFLLAKHCFAMVMPN